MGRIKKGESKRSEEKATGKKPKHRLSRTGWEAEFRRLAHQMEAAGLEVPTATEWERNDWVW
jgi:methionine synthase II (cobalamin-independent)